MNRAIFFDRDGTLIKDKHYLCEPSLIEYFPQTFEVIAKAQQLNYFCFIVTNQSGIGRGYFNEEQMNSVHDKINQDLVQAGLKPFDAIRFCPHTPEDHCQCRKPKTKLPEELIVQFDICASQSIFIGDKDCDYQCGMQAKMKSYLITPNPQYDFELKDIGQLRDKI